MLAPARRGLQLEDFVDVRMIVAEALGEDGLDVRRGELADRAAATAER